MKNSPHKQRLVDAMLTDDNRAHSVFYASLAEPSGFGNTYLFGAGISIFCAVAMFLFLYGLATWMFYVYLPRHGGGPR